jgi:DNA-binding beta-propeller fold protein YncE
VTASSIYLYGLGDGLASFGDNPGVIAQSELDGGNLTDVFSGHPIAGPEDIAFDETSRMIYWTESGEDFVKRAKLDGSGVEFVVEAADGAAEPTSLVVDAANEQLYWANGDSPQHIYQSGLDGSDPEILIDDADFDGEAVDLFLEADGGFLYYAADDGLSDEIRRSALDGTGLETVISDAFAASGLAIDPGAEQVYWSEKTSNSADEVMRANLDDTGDQAFVTGIVEPHAVALDADAGYIYWSDAQSGSPAAIGRAPLDGGTSEPDFLSTGLLHPRGIVVW